MTTLIAIDLGAESGRVIAATLAGGRIELAVLHRFPNLPAMRDGALRWDTAALQAGIMEGLGQAAARCGAVASIGVDTWGVDYALIDARGELVEAPYCYRDKRTDGIEAVVRTAIPDAELFARTGVRPMSINTLDQLVAHRRQHPQSLARATRWLGIPDWLHFWLCGVAANEQTFASTTALAALGARDWDRELMRRLELPERLFGAISPAGTRLGRLRPELCRAAGFASAPEIVMPGSHDTASAVAAVPGDPATTCFISSGTWSLLGMSGRGPLTGEAARAAGYSNEIAADGTPRPLSNIMGLWLLQECRRAWAAAGDERSYPELSRLAAEAPAPSPGARALDVDDPRFLRSSVDSDDMPSRIRAWCAEHGVAAPTGIGATARFILDGLADTYRRRFTALERLAGTRFAAIHVVGGGGENRLLAQLTADACATPVVTGPSEATALGNVLIQALAIGAIATPAEARAVLARSVELARYEPARGVAAPAVG